MNSATPHGPKGRGDWAQLLRGHLLLVGRSWHLAKLIMVVTLGRKHRLYSGNDTKGMRPGNQQPPHRPPPDQWAPVLSTTPPPLHASAALATKYKFWAKNWSQVMYVILG